MLKDKYKAIIKESKAKNIPLAEAARNKGVKPGTFYATRRRENERNKIKKEESLEFKKMPSDDTTSILLPEKFIKVNFENVSIEIPYSSE